VAKPTSPIKSSSQVPNEIVEKYPRDFQFFSVAPPLSILFFLRMRENFSFIILHANSHLGSSAQKAY
jgi:hypothetical protein